MQITLLDPQGPEWNAQLDWIDQHLRIQAQQSLFPHHFLHATLPRIGGQIGAIETEGERVGVAFLFPRQRSTGANLVYTLRYHHLPAHPQPSADELTALASAFLEHTPLHFYDPTAPQYYSPTHQLLGAVDIGRPDAQEAEAVRLLHRQIWGAAPDALYPADIHSIDFAAGTSLVARVEGAPVGFLIGFYKFGGAPLPVDWHERFGGDYRLESQIMGVQPAMRGLHIASLLKQVQAEQAWREGIAIVNWTADPLQYANAALNFGRLRAVAFDFHPDFYPFRNELNRVRASRFGLTWLVGSRRVRENLIPSAKAMVLDLTHHPGIVQVNQNWQHVNLQVSAPMIAIEIPENWTEVQQHDSMAAQQWRAATDTIFSHYVGQRPGQYVITGVAVERVRRFLIGEQVDDALWRRMAM